MTARRLNVRKVADMVNYNKQASILFSCINISFTINYFSKKLDVVDIIFTYNSQMHSY